jgi:hypothetical protein
MSNKIIAEDFKLKKENKKDFKRSIIERHNLTNEFTLADIENHKAELEKMERELKAQIRVSNAAKENVESNHPYVSKMSDEALNAAHYLSETKEIIAKSEAKLKEVVATLKKYKEVEKVVMEKFGFVESKVLEDESAK